MAVLTPGGAAAGSTGSAGSAGGDDDDIGGEVPGPEGPWHLSDERRLRTGLRAVRMRRWVLSVNGERLFLKGANLGPARLALGEASADEVRADVDHAVTAGLDLVRLHGHVGRPETYDAADEAGLLVWQDMPLRGPVRPGRPAPGRRAGRASWSALLGHHPSVAVWCGHDEPVPLPDGPPSTATGAAVRHELASQQRPSWNRMFLDSSVKRALERADGTRPVVAHSGVLPHPPQLDGTDTHLYAGWHWGDERDLGGLARALPRLVRFVSEFGAAAVPVGRRAPRSASPSAGPPSTGAAWPPSTASSASGSTATCRPTATRPSPPGATPPSATRPS